MNRTTVGVIGAGRIGKMHTENLVHAVPEAFVKTVVSPHLDHEWAISLGIPVRSIDNAVVFNDPEIEAVVITASSDSHAELIRQAAAAGKHIFCEKPVAFEPETIEDVLRSRAECGRQASGRVSTDGPTRAFSISWSRFGRGPSVTSTPFESPIVIPRRRRSISSSGRAASFLTFVIHDFDTVRFSLELRDCRGVCRWGRAHRSRDRRRR